MKYQKCVPALNNYVLICFNKLRIKPTKFKINDKMQVT